MPCVFRGVPTKTCVARPPPHLFRSRRLWTAARRVFVLSPAWIRACHEQALSSPTPSLGRARKVKERRRVVVDYERLGGYDGCPHTRREGTGRGSDHFICLHRCVLFRRLWWLFAVQPLSWSLQWWWSWWCQVCVVQAVVEGSRVSCFVVHPLMSSSSSRQRFR